MQRKHCKKAIEGSGAEEDRNVKEDLGDSWVCRKVSRCE